MNPKPHLLIVDDEAGIRESLSSILKEEGYHVEAVGSAEEALESRQCRRSGSHAPGRLASGKWTGSKH